MSATKDRIASDLKQAMLSGDKQKVSVLRGLKSALLYEEVAAGSRDNGGLSEEDVLLVLTKEAKKRQDSADLYTKGDNIERAETELAEKAIIEVYLPTKIDESELKELIAKTIASQDNPAMGTVIGAVKKQVGLTADGSVIARLVKDQLN